MGRDNLVVLLKPKLFILLILILIYPGAGSAAERFTVIGKLVNIRSGPGTKYDVLWQAEMYYPIDVIEESGDWYKFKDFEGDIGWIHKSLVREMPSVVTIKGKCNIRAGPGLKYPILFITEKGVPFKVIKREGEWINVQHSDGPKGWIHSSLVW
jgi:SH3-like domain-containing protein